MRAVAFGVGVVAALAMVSAAVAAMDDPDAPLATARYTASPDAAPPAAQADAPPTADAPERNPPAPPEPAKRYDMAVEDARTRVDASNGQLTGLETNPAYARRWAAPANDSHGWIDGTPSVG